MSGETFPEFGVLCGFTYRLDSARARTLPGLEYRSRARRRRITTDDIAPGHPTTVRSLLVESVQEGHDVKIKVRGRKRDPDVAYGSRKNVWTFSGCLKASRNLSVKFTSGVFNGILRFMGLLFFSSMISSGALAYVRSLMYRVLFMMALWEY